MKDIWTTLEQDTRAWGALDRQGLADSVWADYVTARFSRTGDPRALQFLYPYLNHGDRGIRTKAIGVAANVFRGTGPKAIGHLEYFTRNLDPSLADRAVQVVGAAVTGWPTAVILDQLGPYLNHRNQFIQRQAIEALSRAAVATGDQEILTRIKQIAPACRMGVNEFRMAIARVFSGGPTEEAYSLVALPDGDANWRGTDMAVGILLRSAPDQWYERGCQEFFEPRLHWQRQPNDPHPHMFWPQFTHRAASEGLCRASGGKGMAPLERMLHIRGNACSLRALLSDAPECFGGADTEANRAPLMALIADGDVQQQRIAGLCLGRLLVGSADEEAISILRDRCGAKSGAIRATSVSGLGMVARSTCNEELGKLCMALARNAETATSAIEALGRIFQGSGRSDILDSIRESADACKHRRVPGRKHSKPLAMCYRAAGLLYQGTGSTEPMAFLLDALGLSRARWCSYRWSAARALVTIEFPASTIARTLEQPWI